MAIRNRDGLMLAWMSGSCRVVLQSDSLESVTPSQKMLVFVSIFALTSFRIFKGIGASRWSTFPEQLMLVPTKRFTVIEEATPHWVSLMHLDLSYLASL
ncbi:hypothetical protein RIF29_34604 [Crotalaria pallida]|uniref:Uncharacterized protein n=1 Tax=Crotalaria pallida TaxID=3830 RepID=A0AAN9HTL8_CROPI